MLHPVHQVETGFQVLTDNLLVEDEDSEQKRDKRGHHAKSYRLHILCRQQMHQEPPAPEAGEDQQD